MGLEFDDAAGRRLPTATASRLKMLEVLPQAEDKIPADLREILLGEDA